MRYHDQAMKTFVEKGLLYDRYGALLTPHQREIYEEAVYHDLSLSEIAERHGVSRQSVSDLLNRTTKIMTEYEDKLGLVARFAKIEALCDELERVSAERTVGTLVRKLRKEIM